MELFITREEIRQVCMATVGNSTNAAINEQARQQIDAYIDKAALKVAGGSRWISIRRRASLPINQDQITVDYSSIELARWLEQTFGAQYLPLTFGTSADPFHPLTGSADIKYIGPSGIMKVAVWDQDARRYYDCPILINPTEQDQDRWVKSPDEQRLISIDRGDTPAATQSVVQNEVKLKNEQRARPQFVDKTSGGLKFWPIPDKRYVIHVEYVISPTWSYHQQTLTLAQIDQIPSSVDAEAIINLVCADLYAQQGDDFQVQRYEAKAAERIQIIRGWQSTGERVAIDQTATFDDGEEQLERVLPRWDLLPLVRGTGA